MVRDQFARAASLLWGQPALGAVFERRDELGGSQWASRVGPVFHSATLALTYTRGEKPVRRSVGPRFTIESLFTVLTPSPPPLSPLGERGGGEGVNPASTQEWRLHLGETSGLSDCS